MSELTSHPTAISPGAQLGSEPVVLQSRTMAGRIKMILLLLFCASPVVASYFTYYVIKPRGGVTNYGELIQPQRPIPNDLWVTPVTTLVQSESATLPLSLKSIFPKKWLLVSVHRAAQCFDECAKKLFFMRQLRIAQGSERTRIVPIWLITDDNKVDVALLKAYSGDYAAGHFFYVHPGPISNIGHQNNEAIQIKKNENQLIALNEWLPTQADQTVESYLYLIDPMGNLMMRFPAQPDAKKMYRDLNKLLKWNVIGKNQ